MSAVEAAKEKALKNNKPYEGWFSAAENADDANIIKTFSMIKSGAKETAESVSVSSGTIVRGLAAIKGGATGLWSSLSAFGKIGLVIAGIVAIKKVWDFLDDAFVITGKTAERKMNEASDAYNSAKSDVEAVNTQLEETKNRISEINAKGSLTIADEEEISKHAFGSKANIDAAKAAGTIDANDILFLDNREIGWIAKDGSTIMSTSRTQEAITVNGVTGLGISNGASIPAGTSLDEFVKMVVQKAIPATYTKSTLAIAKVKHTIQAIVNFLYTGIRKAGVSCVCEERLNIISRDICHLQITKIRDDVISSR